MLASIRARRRSAVALGAAAFLAVGLVASQTSASAHNQVGARANQNRLSNPPVPPPCPTRTPRCRSTSESPTCSAG